MPTESIQDRTRTAELKVDQRGRAPQYVGMNTIGMQDTIMTSGRAHFFVTAAARMASA